MGTTVISTGPRIWILVLVRELMWEKEVAIQPPSLPRSCSPIVPSPPLAILTCAISVDNSAMLGGIL